MHSIVLYGYFIFFCLCGLKCVTDSADTCKSYRAVGYTPYMGVYNIVVGQSFQGRHYWYNGSKGVYLMLVTFGRNYWILISDLKYVLSANGWRVYSWLPVDLPEKITTMYDQAARKYTTLTFKCIDILAIYPEYNLEITGYCGTGILLSNNTKNAEVTVNECIKQCESLPNCVSVTLFPTGCYQHKQACLEDSGYDIYFGSHQFIKTTWSYVTNKPTVQSSTAWKGSSDRAVDGKIDHHFFEGLSCTHTKKEIQPWWAVDLETAFVVTNIVILGRSDCCSKQLAGAKVGLGTTGTLQQDMDILRNKNFGEVTVLCATLPDKLEPGKRTNIPCMNFGSYTKYVVIYHNDTSQNLSISLCEVEVVFQKPNRYNFFDIKLTQPSGEEYCKSKFYGSGKLAVVEDEDDFKFITMSLTEKNSFMWIGNNVSSNYYTEYRYPNLTSFSSAWVIDGSFRNAWVKFEFLYSYIIQEMYIMQGFCACSSLKDITLQFSDSSELQFTLSQRNGVDKEDVQGEAWDHLNIGGKTTKYIRIFATSVYDTYVSGGNIVEIRLLGEENGGFLIRAGICSSHDMKTIYTDLISCQIECRNTENCVSFVYFFWGANKDECQLKNGVCKDSELKQNSEANTFEYTVDSTLKSYVIRQGFENNCQLAAYSVPDYSSCAHASDSLAGSTGFATYTSKPTNCIVLCDKTAGRIKIQSNTAYYFFQRTDVNLRGTTLQNFIGCFTSWPEQGAQTEYSYIAVVGPNGNTSPAFCSSYCSGKGYKYTGLRQAICYCRNAIGIENQGCNYPCRVANTGYCGKAPSLYTVHYANTNHVAAEDCIQLSPYLRNVDYDLYWWWYRGVSDLKMQKNFCGVETPILCENMDFDNCYSKPCANGGNCTSTDYTYSCQCVLGYTGRHCDIDINECVSQPCLHGSTCQDEVGGYTCMCGQGYTGVHCETNIDDCISKPCMHESQCVDSINYFTCDCKPGYTGVHCETNINECSSHPCKNYGRCQDQINNFHCVCQAGYEGAVCERDINECLVNQTIRCQHGSFCEDLLNNYKCTCKNGYTGMDCESEILECLSQPCQNGGRCEDLIDSYICHCADGFGGTFCQNNINECWSSPCKHDAPCVDGINKYECQCLPGFVGTKCETYSGFPGNWGEWNQWSECTASCDQGLKYRVRECVPVFPELGGGVCSGSDSESKICVAKSCGPVDGNWGPWIAEGVCQSNCGPGRVHAIRLCDTPMPSNGGLNCTGISERWQLCENKPCPVYSKCASWSKWGECTGSCDSSKMARYRWCYAADFNDYEYIGRNLEYRDHTTNLTASKKEIKIQSCVKNGCQIQGLECAVCTTTFSDQAELSSNCIQKSQCGNSPDNVCITSYSLHNSNIMVKKRCGSVNECPSSITNICRRIKVFTGSYDFSIQNQTVGINTWTSLLTLWTHLKDTCTVCCKGTGCNGGILPGSATLI